LPADDNDVIADEHRSTDVCLAHSIEVASAGDEWATRITLELRDEAIDVRLTKRLRIAEDPDGAVSIFEDARRGRILRRSVADDRGPSASTATAGAAKTVVKANASAARGDDRADYD
jgi:hypothetical protein